MKKVLVVLLAVMFLFAGTAFAAEKAKAAKAAPAKAAKMAAAGKVVEISDVGLKLERAAKGKSEVMDFALEKPVADVKAGDKVTVHYTVKDGKNVASKVTKAEAGKKKTTKK